MFVRALFFYHITNNEAANAKQQSAIAIITDEGEQ